MTIKVLWRYFLVAAIVFVLGACADTTTENDGNINNTGSVNQIDNDDSNNNDDDMNDFDDSDNNDGATNDDEEVNNRVDNQAYMEEKLENSYFKEVEVSISYLNDVDYEFSIDRDDGRIEAEVEDEFTNTEIKGKEAFDFIFERMENLAIDANTTFESVSKQILTAFELDENYVEFEVEIDFHDGSKLSYEREK